MIEMLFLNCIILFKCHFGIIAICCLIWAKRCHCCLPVNLKTVVDEWLDSYKRSREVGLLVLINFIVRSCGCKGQRSRGKPVAGKGGVRVRVQQIIFPIRSQAMISSQLLILRYANDSVFSCCATSLSIDNTVYQYFGNIVDMWN